jgi:uncharacterized protein (TIRG00374 family)
MASASIYIAAILLTFYRWYLLVRAQGLPFTLRDLLRLGLVGLYFSSFLPSSIGGDIVKVMFMAHEQERRIVAVSTVLIDRALGLCGIIFMIAMLGSFFSIVGHPLLAGNARVRFMVFTATAVSGISLTLWFCLQRVPLHRAEAFTDWLRSFRRIGPSLAEVLSAIWMYRLKQESLALAFVVSIASQVGFVVAFFFAAHIFYGPNNQESVPSLIEHFLIVPIGNAIQSLFPSPGGLGGGEYSVGKLYELAGKPQAAGVLAAMARRLIGWGCAIVGYIVYLRMKSALDPEGIPLETTPRASKESQSLFRARPAER